MWNVIFKNLLYWFDIFILIYFIGLNSFYIILVLISIPEIVHRYRETTKENLEQLLQSDSIPPITIIAPAYNESDTIIQSVQSFTNLSYRHIEVIVVNDGSTDDTLQKLMDEYELFKIPPAVAQKIKTAMIRGYYRSKKEPNVLVIDKENGGKADSLNAGINACKTPFFMAVDSDTIIERDALRRMIRPVLTNKNVIASGATIRVANNCIVKNGRVIEVNYPKKLLPSIQVIEYLRAFLFGRLGWNLLGGNLIISGAFGLFNKQAVQEVGGYYPHTVGEDMELVVRLHRHFWEQNEEYNIVFIPDPIAWTEVPSDVRTLARQRERWHRGLIDTLYRHRKMLFNPKYGPVGMLAYPFFVFGEMFAPIIEFFGYLGLIIGLYFNIIDIQFMLFFFLAAWVLMMILTIFTINMEIATFRKYRGFKNISKMFFFAIVENMGYRQLSVFWRLKAFYMYIRKDKSWGKMNRSGFREHKKNSSEDNK